MPALRLPNFRLIVLGHKVVRFADDFVILARSQQRILQAQQDVSQLLAGMGLTLHPAKTQITTFDKGFRFLGHVFAGDVILTAHTAKVLPRSGHPQAKALRLVHVDPGSLSQMQPTQMQQAMVEALKTAQHPIPPPLFVVLGYKVREPQPVTTSANETPSSETWWNPAMSTLYLMQQGTTASASGVCLTRARVSSTHRPHECAAEFCVYPLIQQCV